ncbi:hypothetical protein PanWU01x14_095710 [Parasponia andersonii]|uniref:Uncharacterized protein n=1 Tax=Parasponia andersonii TaxID=3476 RepID=A0A2P5D542_PARAD|nr:hypothetical protein PanWU01x14_095710 [Parasponia andersonii]
MGFGVAAGHWRSGPSLEDFADIDGASRGLDSLAARSSDCTDCPLGVCIYSSGLGILLRSFGSSSSLTLWVIEITPRFFT